MKSQAIAIVPWAMFMLQIINIISGAWSLVLLPRTGLILFDSFYLGILLQSQSEADKKRSQTKDKAKQKPHSVESSFPDIELLSYRK